MIINDPYSGNIFGRLGQGLGQGISEQLPKEIESRRHANAIEGLANNPNLNPIQQAAALRRATVPSHEINTYLPLIQRQQERDIYTKKGEASQDQGINKVKPSRQGEIPIEQDVNIHLPNQQTGFVSPEAIRQYKSSLLQEPEKDQIENLARSKYLARNPSMPIAEAEASARNDIKINRDAQKEANKALREDLNNRMVLDLQGSGLGDFKDISGKIQKDLLDQAEHMVNEQGKSPEEASQIVSNIASELGETANALKENGARSFFSTAEKITDAKAQREIFKKYGYEEQFDNMAVSKLGWTRPMVAHELDPLQNKEINNIFKKFPASMTAIKGTGKMKDSDVDSIIENIKPEDNLFDIEYKLRERGYNINTFKKKVKQAEHEKKISLQPQQDHQIKAAVDNSWWGDILAEAFK